MSGSFTPVWPGARQWLCWPPAERRRHPWRYHEHSVGLQVQQFPGLFDGFVLIGRNVAHRHSPVRSPYAALSATGFPSAAIVLTAVGSGFADAQLSVPIDKLWWAAPIAV